MSDLPTLSQSKANRYNTCKASFHYKYVRGLSRRRVARPLTFGSAIHKVIEDSTLGLDERKLKRSLKRWANEELAKSNYFTAELEMFHEAVDSAWVVMREYHDFWPKDHLTYMTVNGKKAEHEIEYQPKGEDFVVTGKIDAFARSKNKLKWMVEHKSGKTLLSDEDRWRSVQSAVYMTVGEKLGFPEVDGMVWDMVRSKEPTQPQLLKSGTFSLAKLDSLPMVVREVIEAAGQNPNDYPTLLASVEQNRNQWFQRVFQPVTSSIRDHLWKEFIETGREINEFGHKLKRMTIGKHCSWCDFQPICQAIMTGNDADFVIEREFNDAKAAPKAESKPIKPAARKEGKPAIKRGLAGRRLNPHQKGK